MTEGSNGRVFVNGSVFVDSSGGFDGDGVNGGGAAAVQWGVPWLGVVGEFGETSPTPRWRHFDELAAFDVIVIGGKKSKETHCWGWATMVGTMLFEVIVGGVRPLGLGFLKICG